MLGCDRAMADAPQPLALPLLPPRFFQEDLERAALAKFGTLAALEAERERRRERREQRSIASYFQQPEQAAPQQLGGEQQEGQQPAVQQQQQGEVERQASSGGPQAAGGEPTGELASQGERQPVQPLRGQPLPPSQQQQQQQQQQGHSGTPLPTPGPGAVSWLQALPPLVAERVCMVPRQQQAATVPASAGATQQQQQQPEFVLYWMKTAVRAHENPALDAAAAAARQLGLPLLAAGFVLSSHPYASARRCKFLLEGLRDAQAELRRQVR